MLLLLLFHATFGQIPFRPREERGKKGRKCPEEQLTWSDNVTSL
jgi:hypothetical protein